KLHLIFQFGTRRRKLLRQMYTWFSTMYQSGHKPKFMATKQILSSASSTAKFAMWPVRLLTPNND
ncbi:hypothetical protein L9F63_027203, partial [Diploptera punctata]